MLQTPMISSPLKQTGEVDWILPLKGYIRDTYQDDPERYAEECGTLNRLRQDMRGAGKDSASGARSIVQILRAARAAGSEVSRGRKSYQNIFHLVWSTKIRTGS